MSTTEPLNDEEALEGETSEQNLHAQEHEKAEGDERPGAVESEDVTAAGRPETD